MPPFFPLPALTPMPALNTAWQSTQNAAQQFRQQTLVPTTQYIQSTWQGGLTPVKAPSVLERLKRTYIQNVAMELALKAELARRAGFLRLAAVLELQREATLNQLQASIATLAFNTVAPNPLVGLTSQWQLAQAVGTELAAKSGLIKGCWRSDA